MFSDVRILVGMSDILECTKEFERRILKEERMSERAKTRSLLQRRPLSSLSGVLLVRFLPTGAENEHPILRFGTSGTSSPTKTHRREQAPALQLYLAKTKLLFYFL